MFRRPRLGHAPLGVTNKHVARYVAEADFKYNTRKVSDAEHVAKLVGADGRALDLRRTQGFVGSSSSSGVALSGSWTIRRNTSSGSSG